MDTCLECIKHLHCHLDLTIDLEINLDRSGSEFIRIKLNGLVLHFEFLMRNEWMKIDNCLKWLKGNDIELTFMSIFTQTIIIHPHWKIVFKRFILLIAKNYELPPLYSHMRTWYELHVSPIFAICEREAKKVCNELEPINHSKWNPNAFEGQVIFVRTDYFYCCYLC